MRPFPLPTSMDRSPSSEIAEARASVVRVAFEAGAHAVRFTAATPHDEAARRIAGAISRGDVATWPYDADFADRAARPEQFLAGARTVVCIAVAYGDDGPRAPAMRATGDEGRIAIYARGEDYHRRLRALAERVAGEIDRIAGAPATFFACDTAPIAERAFAARAGLGWIGKHTNLIAPGLGSYVFLAEIVTTVPFEPDAPRATHCGSCSRCISACPTGALRGDYTMDATRCISDLTQRTDAIPPALRALVGTWVWGCDLCQDACPPTQLARSARAGPHAPSPRAVEPPDAGDLRALLRLRSGEFKRRYRTSAMGWRGAAILRRNAAVALGNTLDRGAVADLERACADDPHPLVRGHAAWALGRIGSPRAYAALRIRADAEADASVRGEIAAALGDAAPEKPRAPGVR